jgi:hypothetical protein
MGEIVGSFNEPLGLPQGTVRAIITIMLVSLLGVTMFVPVVEGSEDIKTGVLALTVVAVQSYFSSRKDVEPGLPNPVVNE